MKSIVCFVALLGCVLALPSPTQQKVNWSQVIAENVYVEPIEGAPEYPTPRVIGGTEVSRNSIKYQAALLINGAGFCGGSLISRNVVLTAAHCTTGASYVQVILGAHNIQQSEATQVVVTSTNLNTHTGYNPTTLANDIALVRLPSQVTLNNNIQLVSLAPASAGNYAGSSALLTGWGRTSDSSQSISSVLRQVRLNVLTNAQCQATFGSSIISSHICTSGAGNIGACNGDSGGPLVVNGLQVGVVSFGSSRCAAGNPTAFTRVSSFRTWISQNGGV